MKVGRKGGKSHYKIGKVHCILRKSVKAIWKDSHFGHLLIVYSLHFETVKVIFNFG